MAHELSNGLKKTGCTVATDGRQTTDRQCYNVM